VICIICGSSDTTNDLYELSAMTTPVSSGVLNLKGIIVNDLIDPFVIHTIPSLSVPSSCGHSTVQD
jgi:hypothetical protein